MGKLIDFIAFKKGKDRRSADKPVLYVNRSTGVISGSKDEAFAARLDRIRNSIARINRLMAELREYSKER